MTEPEFQQWLKHHQLAYHGFGDWVARLPECPSDLQPCRKEVLRFWFERLEPYDLDSAKDATNAMAAGDIEEPRGFDRHLTAIVDFCRRRRTRESSTAPTVWRDGEELVRCQRCNDDGRLTVWHPKSLRAARNGTLGQRGTIYSTCVACVCEAAGAFQDHVSFRPDVMLPCGDMSDLDELVRFASGLWDRGARSEPRDFADEVADQVAQWVPQGVDDF